MANSELAMLTSTANISAQKKGLCRPCWPSISLSACAAEVITTMRNSVAQVKVKPNAVMPVSPMAEVPMPVVTKLCGIIGVRASGTPLSATMRVIATKMAKALSKKIKATKGGMPLNQSQAPAKARLENVPQTATR